MKEYIIKVDEDKKDIMGNMPLIDKPQELVRCKDCAKRPCIYVVADKSTDDWFCASGKKRE